MKKLTIVIMSAIALIASFTPLQAQAKGDAGKGEKTLGLMGGFATYNSGGFMNLYFQYTFIPHIRIAPEIGYVFRNEGKSAFEMSVDMHFPFRIVRGFHVYPLIGVTFNNWNYSNDGSASRVGGNIGAGFDIYMTSYLKLTLQGKYSIMNDTDGGFFGLGIGYVF